MKEVKKIHIPAKKLIPNEQGVIKVTREAYEALSEVVNETGLSVRQVASIIIVEAVKNNLIVYDREE